MKPPLSVGPLDEPGVSADASVPWCHPIQSIAACQKQA